MLNRDEGIKQTVIKPSFEWYNALMYKGLVKSDDKEERATLNDVVDNELKNAIIKSEMEEVELSDEIKWINPENDASELQKAVFKQFNH